MHVGWSGSADVLDFFLFFFLFFSRCSSTTCLAESSWNFPFVAIWCHKNIGYILKNNSCFSDAEDFYFLACVWFLFLFLLADHYHLFILYFSRSFLSIKCSCKILNYSSSCFSCYSRSLSFPLSSFLFFIIFFFFFPLSAHLLVELRPCSRWNKQDLFRLPNVSLPASQAVCLFQSGMRYGFLFTACKLLTRFAGVKCHRAERLGEDGGGFFFSLGVMNDSSRIELTCVTGLIESSGQIDGLIEYWGYETEHWMHWL